MNSEPGGFRRDGDANARRQQEHLSAIAAASASVRPEPSTFDARSIERPDPKLWTYYTIVGLMSLIFAPIVLIPLYFKYRTLRYRFDDEGISMSVGFLFKHEVHLTYRRIQDIHVTRGLLQRYLGLATISLQTASGSATAEMQIEGVLQADELRDWLYARMRGASLSPATVTTAEAGALSEAGAHVPSGSSHDRSGTDSDETVVVLEQILHEVRGLRERLEERA